jgi:hypothetical protein
MIVLFVLMLMYTLLLFIALSNYEDLGADWNNSEAERWRGRGGGGRNFPGKKEVFVSRYLFFFKCETEHSSKVKGQTWRFLSGVPITSITEIYTTQLKCCSI